MTTQRQQLILAFDVGTTFSGITYCFLDHGQVQKVQGATRFPGQADAGERKIPSVLYYDKEGKVRAVGAEALDSMILEEATLHEWKKAEWFKLHMVPEAIPKGQEVPDLPPNKTAVDVYGDFLKYLLQCARQYFVDSHGPGGESVWQAVQDRIIFVLSHPNGWSGREQSKLRTAAILGGLIPDTSEGRTRITFVTEGEASLHFCVNDAQAIVKGTKAIIIDAGGGTVDISSYKCTGLSPKRFEETAPSKCHYLGSVFVTTGARELLKAKLTGSRFMDDLTQICDEFDQKTKRVFDDTSRKYSIPFGSSRDNDILHGVIRGKLNVNGTDISPLFKPSIDSICKTVLEMHAVDPAGPTPDIYLVGGFAASPWLYSQLQDLLKSHKFRFCRPDGHTNKAVADGAISFYLDRFVESRVAKFTIGTICRTEFDPSDPEHIQRSDKKIVSLSGSDMLPNAFVANVTKGENIQDNQEFRRYFTFESTHPLAMCSILQDIICYQGDSKNPRWSDVEPDKFKKRCTVKAEICLSGIGSVIMRRGPHGKSSFVLPIAIILRFGGVEWNAQIAWFEDGAEKRGPATLMYDEEGEIAD